MYNGKTCTKCKEYRLLEEFSKQKTGRFGRVSQCKLCIKKYKSSYTKNNPERIKEYNIKYKMNNPEKVKETLFIYYKNNREKIIESSANYYKNNIEKVKRSQANYKRDNSEKMKEYGAEWRKNNPEKTRNCQSNYRKNNPEKIAKWGVIRKGLFKKSAVAWRDDDKIKEIYKKRDNLRMETGEEYHVDHIIPLNHPDVCGLHVEYNLQILIASDNFKKGNRFNLDKINE